MKRFSRGIYLTSGTFILLLSIVVVKRLHTFTFAVERYSLLIDKHFSESMHASIVAFLHERDDVKIMKPSDMFTCLRQQFPSIKSIAVDYNASKVLDITIKAAQPVLGLNDQNVLTENGCIVERHLFEKNYIASLNTVNVGDKALAEKQLSESFQEYVRCLPVHFFDQYKVSWLSEREVWLQDKNQKKFSLLCSAEVIPNKQMMDYADHIKESLMQRGAFAQQGTRKWIADMRFANQIVVFSGKGGPRG